MKNRGGNGTNTKKTRKTSKTKDKNVGNNIGNIRSWNRVAEKPAKYLLLNEDVKRWIQNYARTSKVNSDANLRRLNLFCDLVKKTPSELVKIGKKEPLKLEDILMDHVTWMESKGYTYSYIGGVIKTVKSWLNYNRITIQRKIRIDNRAKSKALENEQTPDQVTLYNRLNMADPRQRVVISMMAYSGIRPQVLGNYDRTDGLVLEDLPDLVIKDKDVEFKTTPAIIIVRREINKTRNKYFTFLPKQGCDYLLAYLRLRIASGEVLGPSSPVLTAMTGHAEKGWVQKNPTEKRFLSPTSISNIARPIIKKIIQMRTYGLRAYFDTQMLLAESNGLMTHAYRQFFMGHHGDMEARYTTNRGRMTDQMMQDMKRAYQNSEVFLVAVPEKNVEDQKKIFFNSMLKHASSLGIELNQDMFEQKDQQSSPQPQQQQEIPPRNGNLVQENSCPKKSTSAANQDGNNSNVLYDSVIANSEEEMLGYTCKGWELIKEMEKSKYLMRRDKQSKK